MGVDEVVLMLSISLSSAFVGWAVVYLTAKIRPRRFALLSLSPDHTSTERRRGARGSLLRGASLRS